MRLVICLLLVLFAVIALSYYENVEYFADSTVKINDIVTCASGDVANGKGAGSLYQIVTLPTSTPAVPAVAAVETKGTLNYCPSKAIASTWNPNYSWSPALATLATIDCTKYTLTSTVTVPPTTYKNPALYDGDIVAFVLDSNGTDTLYFYTFATKTLRRVDSFITAQLINTTADKPKILLNMPSDAIINNTPFTITDLNNKTVICKANDPKGVGSTGLYQYVNSTTLNYYPNKKTAHSITGSQWPIPTIMLNDCSKFTVEKTFKSTSYPHHVVPQVSVSDTAYTAMDLQNKSALLQNIQKIVKNELAASRNQSNNNPIAMGEDCCNSDSTCDQQGQEYNSEKNDMSKYIKKDSIPCWGCTLDY